MRRVVDCHVHLYPPEVAAAPRAWGDAHGEPWWTRCVDPPGRRSLQGWADADQLLRDMDRDGVDQAVLLGWYWERQATCDLQNGWHAAWTRAHPDRLRAFAAVQPASGQAGLDGARRALDAGCCGLGELLPPVQGFRFEDDHWTRLAALAGEYRVPVNLHVTNPLYDTRRGGQPATPLEDCVRLVRAFPGMVFILAHLGGGLPLFLEFQPGIKRLFGNVYFDTAASALTYQPGVFRRVADAVGAERILFGTDYPLLGYPRETREPGFARALADAAGSGLTEGELELVLGGNARRVLGVG